MNKNLLFKMLATDPAEVRETIRAYTDKAERAEAEAIKAMPDRGYEQTTEAGAMTADGREVVEMYGRRWALRQDVHAAKVDRQSKTAAPSVQPVREGVADVPCPQMSGGRPCGATLNRSPVCPSCVTGKMGYRYRYTCEACGCDIVTREELK